MKNYLLCIFLAVFTISIYGQYHKNAADYRTDAINGNAIAQFYLGQSYFRGWGIKPDTIQAVYWWRKSAEQGNPAAQITFSPNSDCASFRFMIGYGPGLVEEAGEEAMIAAFGDESLNMSTNPEGLWYDSSVLQGSNGAVFTFVKDALGATVCNYALAYDAEGVPGKISVDTMQFPASLDDLPTSPSSAPTSSMMFHTRYRHLAAIELMDRTSRLKVSNLK